MHVNEDTAHIICYSGGHSSALVALEVAARYGTENLVLLNHDINPDVEDPDIKRFKREISEYLGVPITYANYRDWDTMDQFDIARKHSAFKTGHRTVLCTHRLKTEPFHRWLKENMEPEKNCVVYYGFDANEKVRIQRRASILASMGYRSDYPLALWDRTIQSTREVGIEPPLTYGVWKHANCTGCIKAGRQHWYAVYCTRPDIWIKAKSTEDDIGYSIIKGVFLDELEPMFERMEAAGVEPSEKIAPQTFWARVRKVLRQAEIDEMGEDSAKPCECVF